MAASGSGGRQPGSTFKPVTLAANREAGNGAAQRCPAPAEISLDVGADEPWDVSNAGDRGYGTLTLAEATVNSVNTVYAQAVMQVGAPAVVDMANRLGVRRDLQPHPSIALGAQEVSVLEMATVYSTFARSGVRVDPYLMTKIEDRHGEVIWEHEVGGAGRRVGRRRHRERGARGDAAPGHRSPGRTRPAHGRQDRHEPEDRARVAGLTHPRLHAPRLRRALPQHRGADDRRSRGCGRRHPSHAWAPLHALGTLRLTASRLSRRPGSNPV